MKPFEVGCYVTPTSESNRWYEQAGKVVEIYPSGALSVNFGDRYRPIPFSPFHVYRAEVRREPSLFFCELNFPEEERKDEPR